MHFTQDINILHCYLLVTFLTIKTGTNMKDSLFELELEAIKSPLFEVVKVLYDVIIMQELDDDQPQTDFANTDDELEAQIIYHLKKNIFMREHADIAENFVKQMLKASYIPF